MKYVGAIRKELGIRTVFNILGPLTNPAHPKMQVLGVYDELLVEPLAKVLQSLGVKRGVVVYGKDKLDEISMSAPTAVCEFDESGTKSYEITPEMFGLARCDKSDLIGGTPQVNAKITTEILSGALRDSKRDAVLLNAAAGLYVGKKSDSLADGVNLAAELIDSGAALQILENFRAESNK